MSSIFGKPRDESGDENAQKPTQLPWPGVPMSLRVADGFKFGCGLILAGATAIVLVLLFVAVAFMAARLSGADISLPAPTTGIEPR